MTYRQVHKPSGLISLLALCCVLAGCQNPRNVVVTEKNNNATIPLEHSDMLIVRLAAPGSTDFEWVPVQDNVSRLKPDGVQMKTDANGNRTQLFRFQALDSGGSALELKYKQTAGIPKPGSQAQVFRLKVEIH